MNPSVTQYQKPIARNQKIVSEEHNSWRADPDHVTGGDVRSGLVKTMELKCQYFIYKVI